MPRKLLGVWIILLVSAVGWAQGESVLLPSERFREKVAVAKALKLDTLSAFKRQMLHYEQFGQNERLRLEECRNSFWERGEWVKFSIITRKLSQGASSQVENQEKQRMDSIYAALVVGADFKELARRYTMDENKGEELWLPVVCLLQEWKSCLLALRQGEISHPFYSPEGIHIIRWTERVFRKEEKKNALSVAIDTVRIQEIRETLLALALTKKFQTSVDYNEDDLKAFFKAHKKNYVWELPHYRGAVIHCRNKKEAKTIRKYLKKKSMECWPEEFKRIVGDGTMIPRMEYGLFQIGTNVYVDKLVFKCGLFEPLEHLPYTFVIGKRLKKGPETYEDVKERVQKDYVEKHRYDWLEQLKAEYKVEIDEDILKTVNNE